MSAAYERIYLIGLPGSGKSFMGQALASRLGWEFMDTDLIIEAKTGTSISDLFREKGEQAFRMLESEVISECAVKSRVVVATGGGAPAFNRNMELMQSAGLTIWLNPDLAEIARRLGRAAGLRPLIQQTDDAGIEARLKDLMAIRNQFYRKAALEMKGLFSEYDLYLVVSQQLT